LLPTWIQALELTPGAALLAEALWADSGMALPFVARRVVGAGEVWAFAWGPAAEAAPAQAASRLTGLVADLAASADRGLAAEVDGPDVVVRAPSARGRGRIELAAAGERAWLLEEAPGRFRGPLPCDCRLGVRVTIPAAGADPATTRPVDMPAMAPIEHRGAGVDEDALLRLAEAGGGRRLGAGEEPPLGPSPHGMPLAPWLLLLAVGLFLLERAQAARCATRSRGHEETP
jgi:hypothetical protein